MTFRSRNNIVMAHKYVSRTLYNIIAVYASAFIGPYGLIIILIVLDASWKYF